VDSSANPSMGEPGRRTLFITKYHEGGESLSRGTKENKDRFGIRGEGGNNYQREVTMIKLEGTTFCWF